MSTARSMNADHQGLHLELPAVPTAWRRAAKNQCFPSVESWATGTLDMMAGLNERIILTSTSPQFNMWNGAAREKNMNLFDWVKTMLDAATMSAEQPMVLPTMNFVLFDPAKKYELELELPRIPAAWTQTSKRQGYRSVEKWATCMLDTMAWSGNRFTVASSAPQFDQWCAAAISANLGLYDWVESTLDDAAVVVASHKKGGRA